MFSLVRLVNGPSIYEGRVEVYYNDQWGTVCDDGWSLVDAQVVCTQLKLGYAAVALYRAYYGKGVGPIWLSNLNCKGTEMSIGNCPHSGWGIHTTFCAHSEDAGVRCSITNPNTRKSIHHSLL